MVVTDSGKYKIIVKAYDGAIIKPEGTILAEPGGDYKFVISTQPGYKIDRVEVDGKNIGAVIEYTFKKADILSHVNPLVLNIGVTHHFFTYKMIKILDR